MLDNKIKFIIFILVIIYILYNYYFNYCPTQKKEIDFNLDGEILRFNTVQETLITELI